MMTKTKCVDCDANAVTTGQTSGTREGQRGPKCQRHAGPPACTCEWAGSGTGRRLISVCTNCLLAAANVNVAREQQARFLRYSIESMAGRYAESFSRWVNSGEPRDARAMLRRHSALQRLVGALEAMACGYPPIV